MSRTKTKKVLKTRNINEELKCVKQNQFDFDPDFTTLGYHCLAQTELESLCIFSYDFFFFFLCPRCIYFVDQLLLIC